MIRVIAFSHCFNDLYIKYSPPCYALGAHVYTMVIPFPPICKA